jgi:RNA polymerase sigma-70 factor, ECF subfamily
MVRLILQLRAQWMVRANLGILFAGWFVPEADMIHAAFLSWEGRVAPSRAGGDILAVRCGDPDAFASLLSRYQNRLYRYLLRWVHEPATADDLFQQTWMRVLEHIHSYDPDRNFDAWLFAVARNIAIDHLRRRQPDSLDEPRGDSRPMSDIISTDTPGALELVLRSERAERVQKALASQPPLFREILSLRFEEEMRLDEIAEVLGIPLGSVKSRLSRALEHLRCVFLRMQHEERPS